MRPTEVTDEQIIQAGSQLESEQLRVTGFALRRLIGAGTPARLIKVWNLFKEGAEPAQAPKEDTQPLPGEIEPALKTVTDQMAAQMRQLVVALNTSCQREARTRVIQAEQAAEIKCAMYLEELTDASSQIENAERQIEALERHKQQQSEELNTAHERIAELTGELARNKEKLEQKTLELERACALEAKATKAAGLAEDASVQLKRDFENASSRHAEELCRHKEALSGEQEKRLDIEKTLSHVQVTCDALSEQINTKNTRLASAEMQIKGLQEQLVERGIRVEEQRAELSSKRQSMMRLERQLDEMQTELTALRTVSPGGTAGQG